MLKVSLFFLMLSLSLLASGGRAATLYSDVNHPDASDTYSRKENAPDKPFKTIQRAADVVRAGDTVIVRQGVYPGFTLDGVDGTPEAWITFKSQEGEKVVIDRFLGGPAYHTIYLRPSTSYLILDGFEITNSNPEIDQMRKLNLDDPEDLDEFIRHVGEDLWQKRGGVRLDPPSFGTPHHHLIFRNLKIYHIPGLGFAGKGDDIHFINNHISDLGWPRSGYGFYTTGDRHIYRGNTVVNCLYGFHLYGDAVRDAVIEGNFIHDIGGTYYHLSSARVKHGGAGLLVHKGENNVIRNNVIVNSRFDGIYLYGENQNSLILNNTLYNNGTGLQIKNTVNTTVQNNIVFQNGFALLHAKNQNLRFENNLAESPNFVDPADLDFHLRHPSEAIDRGLRLAEVTHDFDGIQRPQGAHPDIGAYEYMASGHGVTPGAPTRLRIEL